MVIILICMGIMNQFDDGENVGGGMIAVKTASKVYTALIFMFLYAPDHRAHHLLVQRYGYRKPHPVFRLYTALVSAPV